MRLFVAINLPSSFRNEIVKLQNNLKVKKLFNGKYTQPENLHLTLKFLGEVLPEQIDSVMARLNKVKFDEFEIKLGHLGVFNPNYIRIIWVHLINTELIQKKVDDVLKDMFKSEFRFMSHITIARVRTVYDKEKLLDTLNNLEIASIKSKVKKFYLMESNLTPQGPIYKVIKEFSASQN